MRGARFVLAFAALAAAAPAAAQDRIVAVVNNEVITRKDLDDFTTFTRMQLSQKLEGQELENKLASMKEDLLQRLIEDRLILQEAKKSGVKVDDSRVKAKMSEVKKAYDTEKEFAEVLMEQGLSEADVEARIRDQMMMYALVEEKIRSKIKIAPAEITVYYDQHEQEMMLPERRELASLAVGEEKQAKEICAELSQGKDIEALAAERNLKTNKFTFRQGELKKEVDQAVSRLSPGEVSGPVKVNDSFYVFKLLEVLPPEKRSLTSVQDELAEIIFQQKMQENVAAWLEELKKKSYIKITE